MARRRVILASVALLPGMACAAYDDEEAFRSANSAPVDAPEPTTDTTNTTDATVADRATTTVPPAAATTDPSSEPPPTSGPAASSTAAPATATPTTVAPVANPFVAGSELAVSFTFTPAPGGRRIENPYIAVWVEDPDGNLVKTISLWYEQSGEGAEWLSHLSRWTSATDAAVDPATSGATRVAGEYTMAWNGVADDGSVAENGEYVVFVEAARRGGVHDVTSAPITVGPGDLGATFPDSGELSAVSAELVA